MANGDWSFPREGCSCIRFRTQVANRSWMGAQLFQFAGAPAARRMHFLKYEWSYGAPFPWSGSAEWSTEPSTYGDTTATISGTQPTFTGLGPITSDYGNLQPLINQPGTYVFTGQRSADGFNPTNTFTLDSFTAGSSYSITLKETCSAFNRSAPSTIYHILVTQKWSNEFLPARMEALLTDDLENQRAYSSTLIDTRNYFKSQSFSQNIPRGGMREYDDDNFALDPYIAPDTSFHSYGHAARWVSKDLVYAVSPSTVKMINAPFMARCKIYQPGRHSIQSHTLIDTDNSLTIPCQSFAVECPAVSQSELLLIPPPEKDREKKEIYFNKATCTF